MYGPATCAFCSRVCRICATSWLGMTRSCPSLQPSPAGHRHRRGWTRPAFREPVPSRGRYLPTPLRGSRWDFPPRGNTNAGDTRPCPPIRQAGDRHDGHTDWLMPDIRLQSRAGSAEPVSGSAGQGLSFSRKGKGLSCAGFITKDWRQRRGIYKNGHASSVTCLLLFHAMIAQYPACQAEQNGCEDALVGRARIVPNGPSLP